MRNYHINARIVLFWSIIFVTAGAVAAFGLPYGQYTWTEKAWAQDIYSLPEESATRHESLLAPNIPFFLRNDARNVIIGREDTNQDGVVDENDGIVILIQVSGQDGSPFMPLNLGDGIVVDILAYHFVADGSGVVVVKLADNSTPTFLITPDGTAVRVSGLPVLNSPVARLGSLFVANNSNTNNPPTLYIVDEETASLITSRTLERANTAVTFSNDARYMLGFTPTSQLMRIYNLRNILGNPLSFPFTGNIAVIPQWAPQGGMLFYVEEDRSTRAETVAIIDASVGSKQTVTIPNYANAFDLNGTWSSTGRYITVFAVDQDGAVVEAPVAIVDAADNSLFALETPGLASAPLAWSAGDEYLLYLSRSTSAEASAALSLFDAAGQTSTAIDLNNRAPLAVSWHPSEQRLAILAPQGELTDTYQVLVYDVATNALESITELEVATFTAVSLRWLDETGIALAMTFDDLLLESVLNTTYRIDTVTGERIELIPATVRLN